jgi:hypothetical protein
MPKAQALYSLAAAICLITAGAAAQSPGQLEDILERVGQRVQDYFERAQSIMCLETVRTQPIRTDLMPEGPGRTLEYDLRVSWEAAGEDGERPEPIAIRDLRKVNGRLPRPNFEPGCTDPKSIDPEMLAMLLPKNRRDFAFRLVGLGKVKDRPALMIDYKSVVKSGPPEMSWKDDCVSFSIPEGNLKGRIWVDRLTDDVLRLDTSLARGFEVNVPRAQMRLNRDATLVFERIDHSTRYRHVVFHDPDETILVPESIETVQVGRGIQGLRKTQAFSEYRRFLTSGRIVK